jgi:hypothetical protein
MLSSALIFREVFSPVRYAGMALVLGGLAVIAMAPARRPRTNTGRTQPWDSPDARRMDEREEHR